jgi:phosphatidylglycerophosphate synthase
VTPTIGLLVFAAIGVVVIGIALLTAQRPSVVPDTSKAARAAVWQKLHKAPEIDPYANPLQKAFMAVTYWLANPLARRGVLPDALTLVGLWVAAFSTVLAWQGGHWPIAAGLFLVASSFTDGVDGAVAGLTDRASVRGQVLDSVADRFAEVLFVLAIVLAGGAPWAGVLAMSAIMLHEYTRAKAATAARDVGKSEVGTITIGERPTRVIGFAICLIGCGVAPQSAEFIGTWSFMIVTVPTFIGWLQLSAYLAKNL